MSNKISKKIWEDFNKEVQKMPDNLTGEQLRRQINKILKKIIKNIGKGLGIPKVHTKELIEVFWMYGGDVINIEDEFYVSFMKGESNLSNTCHLVDNHYSKGYLSYDVYFDKWSGEYKPKERELIGGYSGCGGGLSQCFRITELDKDDIPNAFFMSSELYQGTGKIDLTYDALEKMYNSKS